MGVAIHFWLYGERVDVQLWLWGIRQYTRHVQGLSLEHANVLGWQGPDSKPVGRAVHSSTVEATNPSDCEREACWIVAGVW